MCVLQEKQPSHNRRCSIFHKKLCYRRRTARRTVIGVIHKLDCRQVSTIAIRLAVAKFHYTGPIGPNLTGPDFVRSGPSSGI